MYELSTHTVQVNGWISLTKPGIGYSDSLHRLGYECERIEQKFYNSDDQLHPDVILTSPDLDHSIVAECKSRTLSSDQLARYARLKQTPKVMTEQGVVTGVNEDEFAADISISSLDNLYDSGLIDEEGIEDIDFSDYVILQFEHSAYSGFILHKLESGEFTPSDLEQLLPINSDIGQYIPTEFYPFDDEEEDHRALAESVFQAVISLAVQQDEFALEDVMNASHRHWSSIGREKKSNLRGKGRFVIEMLEKEDMKNHLEKIHDVDSYKWSVVSTQIQALSNRTEEFVQRAASRLDDPGEQASLGDFLENQDLDDDDEPDGGSIL
jgi:hypothetical protein